jgi:hypothetical protein
MGMTKQLWSINALATELGHDRRTIALALREIRPDGTLRGHSAWYLDTALMAVTPRFRAGPTGEAPGANGTSLPSRCSIASRTGRRSTSRGPPAEREAMWVDVATAAQWMSAKPDDVLTWLRAGCPYAVEGDWATGKGFKLKFHWVTDWTALV